MKSRDVFFGWPRRGSTSKMPLDAEQSYKIAESHLCFIAELLNLRLAGAKHEHEFWLWSQMPGRQGGMICEYTSNHSERVHHVKTKYKEGAWVEPRGEMLHGWPPRGVDIGLDTIFRTPKDREQYKEDFPPVFNL